MLETVLPMLMTSCDKIFVNFTGTDQNMAEDMPLTIVQQSPSEALTTFRNQAVNNSAPEQQIVASRDDPSMILRTMFRLLKCGNFNLQAKPDVTFTDEAGIDAQGLTRELCHMVMASLRDAKTTSAFLKELSGTSYQYTMSNTFLQSILNMLES